MRVGKMRNQLVWEWRWMEQHQLAFEAVVAQGHAILDSRKDVVRVAEELDALHAQFEQCVHAAEGSTVACVADAAPALLRDAVRELVQRVLELEEKTDDEGRAVLQKVRERFVQNVLQCRRRRLTLLRERRRAKKQ